MGLGLFGFGACVDQKPGADVQRTARAIQSAGGESEGNFETFYREQYVTPRLFPNDDINGAIEQMRSSAFAQLNASRATAGFPHIAAQWLDTPTAGAPSCGDCGEGAACFQGTCLPLCSGDLEFPCPTGSHAAQADPEDCVCVPNGGGPGDGGLDGGGATDGGVVPPQPGTCGWTSIGPTNIHGRVTGLAIDPTNNQRLFASTVGGVWRSVDGGRRWRRVTDDLLTGRAAFVAINPQNANEVFTGGGEPDYRSGGGSGVLRSMAGGDPGSWSDVSGATLSGVLVFKLLFAPNATNTIYAATTSGVFTGTRTAGTITWTQQGAFFGSVDDLAIDFAATPPTIFAATEFGDIRKWDGTNWNSRTNGIVTASAARIAIAMAPSQTQTLYARVVSTAGKLVGLYRTDTAAEQPDGGSAWNPDSVPNVASLDDSAFTATTGYAWWGNFLVVDPRSPDVVYSGGVNLFRRTAAGWSTITTGPDATYPLNMHGDQHALVLDPTNPDIVFVGNDGGVNRSTPMSGSWHWLSLAHGMVLTENYQIATPQSFVGMIAGGNQDNGTTVTFGNRTWYPSADCDGSFVGIDAKNFSTVYDSGNCGVHELTQPVPYVAAAISGVGGTVTAALTLPADVSAFDVPIVTDPSVARTALATGNRKDAMGAVVAGKALVKTSDGLTWATILTVDSGGFSALAISPTAGSNGKKTYYAGVTLAGGPSIYSSTDDGATWNKAPTHLPADLQPNAIVVDWTNPARALAAYGGAAGGTVVLTTTSGSDWTTLTAAATFSLPTAAVVTGVAIDANDANTIYVATSVGVFKGGLQPATSSVAWIPFDEGLPNGMDTNQIVVDKASSTLTLGSMGHGSFQRDITPGAACPGALLVTRDNVFDRAQASSPSGLPDPEHPIPVDPASPIFFKPNDTPGGSLYWWDSTDVRVDVPSGDDAAHAISTADSFEFESCPIEIGKGCPVGTMIDSSPVRGQPADAYVQVTNRGLATARNVRVATLFADASLEVPPLPANFWTTTFPAGSQNCGALDTSTGWNLVGCTTIPVVNPELPEVAKFPWAVPPAAASHSCMLTIIDSVDDPVPGTSRATFDVSTLVPNDRHVAQRNLHVVDGPATPGAGGGAGGGGTGIPGFAFTPGGGLPSTPFHGIVDMLVPNRSTTDSTVDILVSSTGLPSDGRLAVLLPPGVARSATGLPPVCGQVAAPDRDDERNGGPIVVTATQLPTHVTMSQLALGATERLTIHEGTAVQEPQGGFADVSNMGPKQTSFADRAQAGNVWSVGSVALDEGVTLSGALRTSGVVTKRDEASIAGGVFEHVTLLPADTVSWTVNVPRKVARGVDIQPHRTQSLAPGRYDHVDVDADATLMLSSGTYVFGKLTVQPRAKVQIDKSSGGALLYVLDDLSLKGTFVDRAGQLTDVLVGYLGDQDISVEGPFAGMIVAPKAELTLGSGRAGNLVGSFFAKEIEVERGTIVVHRNFDDLSAVAACDALDASELAQVQSLGLEKTLYGIPGRRDMTIRLSILPGQSIRLGLRYESGRGQINTAGRIRALSLRGGAVKGGNTFVLRFN